MIRVVLAVVSLAVVACTSSTGTLRDGRFTNESVSYAIAEPGEGWEEVTLPSANAVWHNQSLGAALMVSSHCEGVADAPLEGLTSDLLMGLSDREILSQERVPSSKREAMHSIVSGKLDGVPRKLELFVLKKDGCVYDIVLNASPEHFVSVRAAFARVCSGFDVDARPNRG